VNRNQPHLPNFEPKSSSATAIPPANILLIHSIMSGYVQMTTSKRVAVKSQVKVIANENAQVQKLRRN
jgi:hypothetical protein